MKQIWPTYAYSPTTNVLTLTGLNIDRDQLLLVTAADRGRIMYNFADSSVTASAFTSGANTALTLVATTAGLTTTAALVIYYDDQLASATVTVSSLPAISGTVTADAGSGFPGVIYSGILQYIDSEGSIPVSINPLPAGTNRIGVVTIGAGTVTIAAGTAQIGSVTVGNSVTIGSLPSNATGFFGDGKNNLYELFQSAALNIGFISDNVPIGSLPAGTAQIGSVTASISGTVPISISSVTVGNSVTIVSLPAISGTVTANVFGLDQQDGTSSGKIPIIGFETGIEDGNSGYVVPVQISNTSGAIGASNALPISGTVTANTFALQGTAVTPSNFTSTTASTLLASFNATREVLTIFNEGAGNLHIAPGATCTTIAYQVRLSAGDYYEVPNHQTTITHSAVFATAGTARVCQVS